MAPRLNVHRKSLLPGFRESRRKDKLSPSRFEECWQGRLLAALEESGLADDTYVLVSFDHGASGRNSNLPLAGGKGSLLEGGVRVPFLVRGPGVSADSCCHTRASSVDLNPASATASGHCWISSA